MLRIAQAKKQENIAEYLLYLWQMEDLLRGVEFDLERLDTEVLSAFEDEKDRSETRSWLGKLAAEMKSDGVQVSGHHRETYELLNELALLQQTLLTVMDDKSFQAVYADARPVLDEFRTKTDKVPRSDVEIALTAMYGVLTLRLAKREVSAETLSAFEKIKPYIRYLAKAYRQMRTGTFPMNN